MKLIQNIIKILACTALLSAFSNTFAANPLGVDQMVIFGDSLSDAGVQDQNPDVRAGKEPTWTNKGAKVWPELVADLMGIAPPAPNNQGYFTDATITNAYVSGNLGGTDYAAGGSTTGAAGYGSKNEYFPPALRTYTDAQGFSHEGQVERYLSLHQKADPKALYVIWSGPNDIFSFIQKVIASGQKPDITKLMNELNTVLTSAANNVSYSAKLLYNAGAKHIMVLSMPNLAITPEFETLAKRNPTIGPVIDEALQAISYGAGSAYNAALMQSGIPSSVLIGLNVYTTLNGIYSSVASKGAFTYSFNGKTESITNMIDMVCPQPASWPLFGDNPALVCANQISDFTGYFFADGVHPSTYGQQIIANLIYNATLGKHDFPGNVDS